MSGSLRGKTAIVGAADARVGRVPSRGATQLCADAMTEYLQVFPRCCISLPAGGATTITALHQAASAIASGICSTVILTSAERALDAPKPTVYLLGVGAGHSHEHISQAGSLTTSAAARESGRRAFEMAGVRPQQMHFAQVHDCFTP